MTPPPRTVDLRRIALWSLPVAVLLLLCAARLLLVVSANADGQDAYAARDFASAQDEFEGNRLLNPVQRWVAPFNEGAARHRAGDLVGALSAYDVALRSAPSADQCRIRENAALAHEAIGDKARGDGDLDKARRSWQAGRDILAAARCPQRSPQAKQTDDRLADKLRQQPTQSPTPTTTPSPSRTSEDPQTRRQLDQLEELNRQGEESRRQNEELRRGGSGGTGGYHW